MYNRDEFKLLNQDQKHKLSAWRTSAVGKAAIDAVKAKFKAKRDAKNQKQEGGGGNAGGGDDKAKGADVFSNKKLQKKFQAAVVKASKKVVAAMDGHPAKIPRIIYFYICYVCYVCIRVKSTYY